MATNLTRITQFIFGSTAGGDQIGEFGSLAASDPTFTTDPEVAMNTPEWLGGWFSAILGGNSPAIEDMNAFCFVVTYQLAYLLQKGVPQWDAGTTYYTDAIVKSGGVLYVSLVDTNLNHDVTDNTKWKVYGGSLNQQTANYAVALSDDKVEMNATGGARTVTLLAVTADKYKSFTITKTDSSTNPVTVTDGTFTAQLNAQYDSITVYSNGAVHYEI